MDSLGAQQLGLMFYPGPKDTEWTLFSVQLNMGIVFLLCLLAHSLHLFRNPYGSLEHHWRLCNQLSPSFPVLFSTALSELANSGTVHSLMLSSYLFFCLPLLHSSLSLMVPCKMFFARVGRWSWDVAVSVQFAFLDRCQVFVWSDGLLDLLRTSSLVTWSVYERLKIFRKHLMSMVCILLCRSAEKVHVSQAYRKMGRTRERL